ncbi:hypothetical protein ACHAQA_000859 [Verticillium albo-atrum]
MSSSNPDQKASSPPATNPDDTKAGDVNAAVEELLNTISNKFAGISSEIFAKMDEMSRRLDNLEAALLTDKDKEETTTPKPT